MLASLWQKLTQNKLLRSVAFGVILSITLLILKYSHALATLEFTALNFTYTSRDNLPLHDDIRFWNIDESDILMLRWPWSWEKMGLIINGMKENGVKISLIQESIFSDKRLPSMSEESALAMLEKLEEALDDSKKFEQEVKNSSRDTDIVLKQALKNMPNALLSQAFVIPDQQDSQSVAAKAAKNKAGFLKQKIDAIESIAKFSIPWPREDRLLKAINMAPLHPYLSEVTGGIGFQRVIPDDDGTIRRAPTVVTFDGRLYFSQQVVMAARYFNCAIDQIEVVPGKHLKFKGVKNKKGKDFIIPIDEQGLMIVNWTSKEQLAEFSQAPFQYVKLLLSYDIAKKVASQIEFDPDNLNSWIEGFNKFTELIKQELVGNGWVSNDQIDPIILKAALAWTYQTAINNGADLPELYNFQKVYEPFKYLDQVTFYNSILLNSILAANFQKGDSIPTLNDILTDSSYPFHLNQLTYSFIENNLSEEGFEFFGEHELLVEDESYSGKDDPLYFLKYQDLDREAYRLKLMETSGANLETLDRLHALNLYDILAQRKIIIEDGYHQMIHHIEHEQLKDVTPFYFFSYNNLDKHGVESKKSLLQYKDKIVFLGLTATGLNALNPTPYTQRYTMAALAPAALNTILTESFIYEKKNWEPLLMLFYSIVVLLIIFYFPAYFSHPLCLLMIAAHAYLVLKFMNNYGIVLSMVFPILSIAVSHIGGNLYLYWEQLQERKKVRGMFAAMVSPEVLKIMEDDPDKFNLQGEKVEASMFSSDVSGFTSISEGVTAQELALILNLYLTPMSNLVMIYGGYVEKYEGDAIKADFGMPMPDDNHAWKACYSALLQQEELFVVQRMLQLKYGVMITARMGVNTGIVNAGNMGSVNKMQYCAIGEEVAMAEELEPSNKMWETWIAISPETLRLSGDRLKTRMLDVVDYHYVTIPVYELLGWEIEAFLEFWKGKPIPQLVIEGWQKIIPEKILAYLNYYEQRQFVGNAFYDLMMESYRGIEDSCMEYVKVSDKLNLWDLEQRYSALLKLVDSMEVKVSYDELDLVDQTEWKGLEKAIDSAKEEWLIRLNSYLFELKKRTHVVNRMNGKQAQNELDEILTSIDTLEKNCNCYIKRNRFPAADDRYGNIFKNHLIEILPNPEQNLGETDLTQLRSQQTLLEQKIKQAMNDFIAKSKTLAEPYHDMMSKHCLISEKKQTVCNIFSEGRELYLKREWRAAKEKFEAGLALVSDDGPCLKYIERCVDFEKNPPAEDWKGVWEANW